MPDISKARVLASLLLAWHEEHGLRECSRLGEEMRHHYQRALGDLSARDLSQESAIRDIANAQTSGAFEWSYPIEPPLVMWRQTVGSRYPELPVPANLGQIGNSILELLSARDTDRSTVRTEGPHSLPAPVDAHAYALPREWKRGQVTLTPHYARLPLPDTSQLARVLRDYFAWFSNLDRFGIGGREFLVAMNQDVRRPPTSEPGYVMVFDPASLGFQLSTGDRTLVNAVLEGSVTVEEVVLG
jgi:hypothetical protein